ncbi:MAG: hypothetical protein RR988_05740 [Clostridia bacterium]
MRNISIRNNNKKVLESAIKEDKCVLTIERNSEINRIVVMLRNNVIAIASQERDLNDAIISVCEEYETGEILDIWNDSEDDLYSSELDKFISEGGKIQVAPFSDSQVIARLWIAGYEKISLVSRNVWQALVCLNSNLEVI